MLRTGFPMSVCWAARRWGWQEEACAKGGAGSVHCAVVFVGAEHVDCDGVRGVVIEDGPPSQAGGTDVVAQRCKRVNV